MAWHAVHSPTLINSIGHTDEASAAPAMHPAVIAVSGLADFVVADILQIKTFC
jgi:hypothetical protein